MQFFANYCNSLPAISSYCSETGEYPWTSELNEHFRFLIECRESKVLCHSTDLGASSLDLMLCLEPRNVLLMKDISYSTF